MRLYGLLNLGFSDELIERVFKASATFSYLSQKNKIRSAYLSAEENFGYQAFASEHLDPASPPDLKEDIYDAKHPQCDHCGAIVGLRLSSKSSCNAFFPNV